MLKVLLQLKPMDCPSCGKKIEEELVTHKGVIAVKVFQGLGKVRTDLAEKDMNIEQLMAIIKDLGYMVISRKIEKENEL